MKGFKEIKKLNSKGGGNESKLILDLAIENHKKGNISKAEEEYKKFLKKGFKNPQVFSNLAIIYASTNRFEPAISLLKKSINLYPNDINSYFNLGKIYKNLKQIKNSIDILEEGLKIDPNNSKILNTLGNLYNDSNFEDKAEEYFLKALKNDFHNKLLLYNYGNLLIKKGDFEKASHYLIESIKLDNYFAKAYYSLCTLPNPQKNIEIKDLLFSDKIIKKIPQTEIADIYFARSQILHKIKDYKNSSINLKLANDISLQYFPSEAKELIQKAEIIEKNYPLSKSKNKQNHLKHLFIVGMPRSGSTLIESIINMNSEVEDLGETNIFEESLIDINKNPLKMSINDLESIYIQKVKKIFRKECITTNKNLLNFVYSRLISNEFPNAKIVYCFRNPLDNILSLYRANFRFGMRFSSSIEESAKIYIYHENLMKKFIDDSPHNIFPVEYEKITKYPELEIKKLILWLGFDWNESYLNPHLSKRNVSTASDTQIRTPINTNSIGGWKNYKELLKPAIDILKEKKKYKNIDQ